MHFHESVNVCEATDFSIGAVEMCLDSSESS